MRQFARIYASGDGGGRHDRPCRPFEYPPVSRRCERRRSAARSAISSATPHRMSRSRHLDRRRAPKASSTSSRITTPATIVGARSGCRPRTARRSASGSAASRSSCASSVRAREHVALDPRRVVGLEREVDRGARRRGAGDRDGGLDARARTRARHRGVERGAHVGGERGQLLRRSAGRRGGGARCGGRRRPAWRRGSPAAPPAPQTSSVDPPPMSITTSRSGRRAGRAAVAPANVAAASSSPLSVRPSSPKRVADRGRERRAVGRVAHRRGHHRGAGVAAVARDRRRVALERGEHARLRRLAEPARRLDALAEPRDGRLAPRSVDRSVGARRRRPGGAWSSSRCRRPPRACAPDAIRLERRHGRSAGAHRLLGLELRRLARARLPAGLPAAPLARPLRDAVRHRRGQLDLLPARPPGGRRALGRGDAARLRLRGQGEPLPDPHAAPAPTRSAASSGSTRASPRSSSSRQARARPVAAAGELPPRRRPAGARARAAAAGPPLLRVPPPELVRAPRSTACCTRSAPRS